MLSENSFAEFPEGEYELQLVSPEFVMAPLQVKLVAGETRSIDIPLQNMGELILEAPGQVARANQDSGTAQEASLIRIFDQGGVRRLYSWHLPPGKAERISLPEGEYQLESNGSRSSVTILAGECTPAAWPR